MVPLTKRERRAVMTVAVVVLLSAVIQWMRPHEVKTGQFDYTLQDSLFRVLSADTVQAPPLKRTESLPRKVAQTYKTARKRTKKRLPAFHSINPNSADAGQLERLPYIGPKTARAIIRYRQEHGAFKTIEELDNVKRIGPKTIERIRPYLIIPKAKLTSDTLKK